MTGYARRFTWRHWVALAAVATGFAITIVLGVWAAGKEPPNGAQSALLVVLAGVFQIGGTGFLYRAGRSDPMLARSIVRKLVAMVLRAQEAEHVAEEAFESAKAKQLRDVVGQLSVHLSYLREDLQLSVEVWNEIHPGVLDDAREEGVDESD